MKFCKNCKYMADIPDIKDGDRYCRRPILNLVTGIEAPLGYGATMGMPIMFCSNQRMDTIPKQCGSNATYFAVKDSK